MGTGRSGIPKGVTRTTGSWTNNLKVKSYTEKSVNDAADFYRNNRRITSEEASKFGLNPSQSYQALAHHLDLHGKPIVLTDADYDKQMKTEALDGVELYRGVGSQRSVQSTMFSEYTYIGDGIHGDGLYFSTNIRTAHSYGREQMTGYIDKTLARPVTESSLRKMLRNESYEVRTAFAGDSGLSAYAIYKGYNVIHVPGGNAGSSRSVRNNGKQHGEDYYVPLVRDIIVFRENARKLR